MSTAEVIPTFHEKLPELEKELVDRGSLGVLVLDATVLSDIEDEYGTDAFQEVRLAVFKVLGEQQGKDYRVGDILTLDRPRGMRFLFFLERKRRRNVPFSAADLRTTRLRLVSSLVPKLGRAAFPYFKSAPRLDVGYGIALFNPLLHPERVIQRAVDQARDQAAHQRKSDDLLELERLQDVLLRERVTTLYQPILRLKDEVDSARVLVGRAGTVKAFEALSRGARGTGLETADVLFRAAEDHKLTTELDRLCRRRALLSSGRVPSTAKIFVNTLPATIRDPQFRGKPLIDFLEKAQVAPERIVIEITEGKIIENYDMFRGTMHYFTDLGMSFAVDDVGTGYTNFEAIAELRPAFLKIDISLVHDVHVKPLHRANVKAIIDLGHGIGAAVIAEGIETEDEAQALRAMGVDFGQGYHLARPDPGPE